MAMAYAFHDTKPQGNTPRLYGNIYLICLQNLFHICIILTYLHYYDLQWKKSTSCAVLVQLPVLVDCFFWSSAVTIQAPIRQFRISLLPSECFRLGALVQSSAHPLTLLLLLLSDVDFIFLNFLAVTQIFALCLLSFVSINTEGISNVV